METGPFGAPPGDEAGRGPQGVGGAAGRLGADLLLRRLFGENRSGFYVSIHAGQPDRSAALPHRLTGWNGINICASPEWAAAFAAERPNDINLTFAAEAFSPGQNEPEPTLDRADGLRRPAPSTYPVDLLLRSNLPPGQRIDLFNLDAAETSLSLLRSNDWTSFRSAVLTVDDPELARNGVSAIRTFIELQGYALVGRLFDTSIYALPEFLDEAGASLRHDTWRLRFDGHPGNRKAERHDLASSQAESLRRQLASTEAANSALRSSVAWRLALPLHRLELKIGQWRESRRSRSTARGLTPSRLDAIREAYDRSIVAAEPDTFVVYRILGNDLSPRHGAGQSFDNASFILDHEPDLPSCEKRWIVNRIYDTRAEAKIIDLLERRGQRYARIPFDFDEYARIDWALEDFPEPGFLTSQRFVDLDARAKQRALLHARWRKNAYVMNNNGARNAALADGRRAAKWILPWDGNCFLSADAWENIRAGVCARPYLPYFIVPMARVLENAELLGERPRPPAADEPQIIFRKDSGESFNEDFVYGRRSKVELLYRLGVPGTWDRWWNFDHWDPEPGPFSEEADQFAFVGWVARLNSGMPELEAGEGSFQLRGWARGDAIITKINYLDNKAISRRLNPVRLAYYDEEALDTLAARTADTPLADQLRRDADKALARGLYSVVDKPAPPRSGDLRDYWSIASDSKLAGSDNFDRTRLQRLFDDTTVAALAWRVHGKQHTPSTRRRSFGGGSSPARPA